MTDEFLDNETEENEAQEPRRFRLDRYFKADRLDKVLAQLIPEHSRGRLQTWIENGFVSVQDKPAKVRQLVGPGDVITVIEQASEESKAFLPERVEFEVMADSQQWIVVNKPVGLVTHPGTGNWRGTLLNGLLYRYPELAHVPRAGIVHRLDKDTSGLLVVARTETAQTHLVRQLQARSMGRQYRAIVAGLVKDEGTVDQAMGRDARVPIRMSVERPIAPKSAITHYRLLSHGHFEEKPVSLIECRLETGRTHQIRVHMASLGHPLLGDTLYGSKMVAPRQMLHAYRLNFIDPETEQMQSFSAPMATDMLQMIENIKWDTGFSLPKESHG